MMLIDLKNTDKAALRQKTLQKAPLRSSGKIGSDIRALRRSRNWTLNDLAEQLDRSVGWLSQVERNVSEPALDDIRKIAGLFSLPVSFFFTDAAVSDEAAYIVRAGSRRIMSDAPKGLAESLLSPDLGGAFEIVHSVFAPGQHAPSLLCAQPKRQAMFLKVVWCCSLMGFVSNFIQGIVSILPAKKSPGLTRARPMRS